MDGETITAITITATVNIVTIISMVYYLKGKVESMEKSTNHRFEDLKEYINNRLNDFYKMFNARIKNLENIIYNED